MSPTIGSLYAGGNVTLHASTPIIFTITRSLFVTYFHTLKDSTSADVPFNMVFNGATGASGQISGGWNFEGGVPIVNRQVSGAFFTAQPGSTVSVSPPFPANSFPPPSLSAGHITFQKNTGTISSDKTSLVFEYGGKFILDGNLDAKIPLATWFGDLLTMPSYGGGLQLAASSVVIRGNMDKLEYSEASPAIGRLVVDLPLLSKDADLSLPDGTWIKGNLEILNTNGHTLTLLAATGPTPTVSVTVGFGSNGNFFGGALYVNGNNTKVTLARAATASAATNYTMKIWKSFEQTGGNFSLQDFNGATGTTTLAVTNNLTQTGGTFYTNSTSTQGKFVVHMVSPYFITGPSGSFQSLRSIDMSSGSIDNATHRVTLRIEHSVYYINGYQSNLNGVRLEKPLQVGRLDLVKSPLTTTAVNILTVNDPSADAITIGGPSSNYDYGPTNATNPTTYVNGPLRRVTNSTQPYFFPVGKGNYYGSGDNTPGYTRSFLLDSVYITPVSATPSVYEVEYFKTAYTNLDVSSPLVGVSNTEYWNIAKVSGADAAVGIFLNSATPGASPTSAVVTANFVNGHWIAQNGTLVTPGNATRGAVTSKPLSAFGLFSFGYGDPTQLNQGGSQIFNGLNYRYYEGGYSVLPNFNTLTPLKTGNSSIFDLGIQRAGVNDSFAIVWEGYINVPMAGSYTFETVSDDGSKLYFNSLYNPAAIALVNNDSTHPPQTATGTVFVPAPGRYPITLTYFEAYGDQGLQVYWTGPGLPRQQIPASAFTDGITMPPITSGLNYKMYQGSFDQLPGFALLIPVKTGNSPNVDISVRTPAVDNNFAFVWEGNINIPEAGDYNFETISDDGSKLYFNGTELINNDGIHAATSVTGAVNVPSAGSYPIKITFFEKDGGETMQVYWSGPGINRQLIPNTAFGSGTVTPPAANGLTYKYFEGDFNMLPDFTALTPVKTGTRANIDLGVRTPGIIDHYALIWNGYINLPAAGTYTFETVSDDGSKVYFNTPYSATGNSLVNNDGLHAPTSASGTITVQTAGAYPITITFFEKNGGETMELYWSGPGITRQRVPDEAFGGIPPPNENNGGLNFKYYNGNFNLLPDFSSLTPARSGTSNNIDLGVRPAGVNDHYAILWDGYVNLPAAGSYTFETISDDGSKVYFNMPYSAGANSLVNNDGIHAPLSAIGTVTVPVAGRYPITVTFYEKEGGETMQLYWSGPGISRELVPDAAFTTSNNASGYVSALNSQNSNFSAVAVEMPGTLVRLYPNPFAERFVIDYFNAGSVTAKVSVGIYDLNGKLMYNYQPANLVAGQNKWVINTGTNMNSGVYMAQVKVNGLPVSTVKVVKL